MKKILKITESELKNLIPILLEEFDINDYSDEDFVEVFVKYYRNWVKKKHGDEIGGYPMSYLVKKYEEEFLIDVGLKEDRYYYYGSGATKFSKIGRDIILKQLETLPSLSPNKKFTEKYKKQLDHLIKYLDIPDYVKLNIEEVRPNNVNVEFEIDYPSMLISDDDFTATSSFSNLKKYLENFMGIEYGSPSHGLLKLDYHVRTIGSDEFVRKIFNKQIKPELKKLPSSSAIHSMKITTDSNKLTITLIYRQSSYYGTRNSIKAEIKRYFEANGFSPKKIVMTD
jgi:hypothetical protein